MLFVSSRSCLNGSRLSPAPCVASRRATQKTFAAALAAFAVAASVTSPAFCEVLSGQEFQKLIAGGSEGTTIVFQGGADRLFFSAALKNRLRRSAQLGTEFLKQKVQPNTISEGVFVSAMIENGKRRVVTGVAGITADQDSGHGVLTMIQTFPEDTTIKAFEKQDRLYSVLIVEDTENGLVCRRSRWEKLFSFKGEQKMTSVLCEFTVGNAVTPALSGVPKKKE